MTTHAQLSQGTYAQFDSSTPGGATAEVEDAILSQWITDPKNQLITVNEAETLVYPTDPFKILDQYKIHQSPDVEASICGRAGRVTIPGKCYQKVQ